MKKKSRVPWERVMGLTAFRAAVFGLRAAGGVGTHRAKSEDSAPAEVMMYGKALNWGKKAGIFAKQRGIQHGGVATDEAEKEAGSEMLSLVRIWGFYP